MAIPKILLISRRTLEHPTALKKFREEHLAGVEVQMAVAVAPADAEAAKKLTEAVAKFEYVTAIVADFEGDIAINDDGSIEPLGMTVFRENEGTKLITEV